MHPAIRIVCFLLFCILLARTDNEQLILAGLLVGSLLLTLSADQWRRTFSMVRRLRWLLLSILIIYGWFTPGPTIPLPLPEFLWPSRAGVEDGAARLASLILILLAAGLLLTKTPREQMIAALYWLLHPLSTLRLSPQRFAVRLSLTLDYVEQQEGLWQRPVEAPDQSAGRLNRIARHLAGLLPRLFEQAERASTPDPVSIELLPAPPLLQWAWPLLLVAGFVIGAWVEL